MADFGIRVWNAAGQLTVDLTDRLPRYFTTVSVGQIQSGSSVTLTVAGYALDGDWFFLPNSVPMGIGITEQAGSLLVTYTKRYSIGPTYSPAFTIDIYRVG